MRVEVLVFLDLSDREENLLGRGAMTRGDFLDRELLAPQSPTLKILLCRIALLQLQRLDRGLRYG